MYNVNVNEDQGQQKAESIDQEAWADVMHGLCDMGDKHVNLESKVRNQKAKFYRELPAEIRICCARIHIK